MSITRERTRNFLAYGFGISIAVHAIVLPLVNRAPDAVQEVIVDQFNRDPMPTPPPAPLPTPTPKPTLPPPRHATPPPHHPVRRDPMLIRVPHQDAHPHAGAGEPENEHLTGDPNANPGPLGTPVARAIDVEGAAPAATPIATPKPTPTPLSCARPNIPATTLRPLEPDTPALAQQQGISGVVQVVVSLDAQSRVVGTRIQSSPSAVLNASALAAARGSQFRTEVRNCESVAADYIFSVDFSSQ